MKGILTAGTLLLVWGALAGGPGVAQSQEMNLKIGINRISYSGPQYTHDDGSTEYTNTDSLVGNDIFIEYIISNQLGLEIDSTITPVKRTYVLESGSTVISANVTEQVTYITYGANLYFNKAVKRGFKFLLGVATGTATVTHEFEGGTLGTQSTTSRPALTILKLGMDWVTKMAGIRVQYQIIEGNEANTTELAGVKQTVNLTGNILALGVFAFF